MSVLAAFAVPHPPLIIPAVGRGQEKGIPKTIAAYQQIAVRVAEFEPETIVLSTPHTTLYQDYFHISPGAHARGSFAAFGVSEAVYEVDYDEQMVRELEAIAQETGISAGSDYEREPTLDHATMIPLHFIQECYRDFKLVRIGLSGFDAAEHYRMGQVIAKAAERLGRRVVYIASGDLSHKLKSDGPYGYAEEGPIFDETITKAFAAGDFLALLTMNPSIAERAAECGLRSFQMMAGALDGMRIKSELLSYEGTYGVGYAVASFEPVEDGLDSPADGGRCQSNAVQHAPHESVLAQYEQYQKTQLTEIRSSEDPYVQLARASLETYIAYGVRISPEEDAPAVELAPELLEQRAGCFVSLKIAGRLRGCIGTLFPVRKNLAEEICANAISAGTQDSRFSPVRPDELDKIVYDVDVLSEVEPVSYTDELDPRRFGVIIRTPDGKCGVLLPDLDGVDSVEEQLSIAAQKGGIDFKHDTCMVERFEVVRHL